MKSNLNFLDTMFDSKLSTYKNQKYLKSNFDEDIWNIELKDNKFSINFNIKLTDGEYLTKNGNLLNTVKFWILSNTLPEKGIAYSDSATKVGTPLPQMNDIMNESSPIYFSSLVVQNTV